MIKTLSQNTSGPLFLIFHDNSQDVKYLRSGFVNAPLPGLSYQLPVSCEAALKDWKEGLARPLYVVDTAELFAALEGEGGAQKKSLERVCRLLRIPTEYLHNAGNDARVCTSFLSLDGLGSVQSD